MKSVSLHVLIFFSPSYLLNSFFQSSSFFYVLHLGRKPAEVECAVFFCCCFLYRAQLREEARHRASFLSVQLTFDLYTLISYFFSSHSLSLFPHLSFICLSAAGRRHQGSP